METKKEHTNKKSSRLRIVYEDTDITIISKPSGMLTCPYPGSPKNTALDILLSMRRKRGLVHKSTGVFVVHRLDRDTSGLLIFAHTKMIAEKLMNNWHKNAKLRLYRALVESNPSIENIEKEGIIDAPLCQNAYKQSYVAKTSQHKGKNANNAKQEVARTNYRIIKIGERYSLFELKLDTGKKNQIRAHLSFLGFPIAGDTNYRAKTDPFNRLCLHAAKLVLVHPITNEELCFEDFENPEWLKKV